MKKQFHSTTHRQPAAFSLIELVIVIVMIGIIAAIAVPRFSSAKTSASRERAEGTVAVLQDAINLFVDEHDQSYIITQTVLNGSKGPPAVESILTVTTHQDGAVVKTGKYGPYLRTLLANPLRSRDATKFLQTEVYHGEVVAGVRPEHGWIFTYRKGKVVVGYINADGKAVWPQGNWRSAR